MTELNDLTDVTITDPDSGHIIQYDGSVWVNRPPRIVNVKDFGAVGDGTGNDAPKIQDALDSLPTNNGSVQGGAEGGGYVYLPPGTYRITEPIVLSSGQKLRGDPYGTKINAVGLSAGSGAINVKKTGAQTFVSDWGVEDLIIFTADEDVAGPATSGRPRCDQAFDRRDQSSSTDRGALSGG